MGKEKSSKLIIIFGVALCLILAIGYFLLAYRGEKIFSYNVDNIEKIHIFNGGNGKSVDIANKDEIKHIIDNLNNTKLVKGESSLDIDGYKYSTTIYFKDGSLKDNLTVYDSDSIAYNDYFYSSKSKNIDIEYINKYFTKS